MTVLELTLGITLAINVIWWVVYHLVATERLKECIERLESCREGREWLRRNCK